MNDTDIIKVINAEKAKKLLEESKRADGRGLLDYRNLEITRGIMKSADGS